jgi:hypothetical protein
LFRACRIPRDILFERDPIDRSANHAVCPADIEPQRVACGKIAKTSRRS